MSKCRKATADVPPGSFPMPNSLFQNHLGVKEISIFCLLVHCASRKKDPKWLSCSEIGEALHISKNTVMRHLKKLKELGLVPTGYKKRTLHSHSSPWKNPDRDFFLVPNELFGIGLCAEEIAIFCYLTYWSSSRKDHRWPGYGEIAGALGLCKNTVMKYIFALEKKNLISTRHTMVPDGTGMLYNGKLNYVLHTPDNVREEHNARELRRATEEAELRRLMERAKKAGLTITPLKESSENALPF